jgi:hypothetical protein
MLLLQQHVHENKDADVGRHQSRNHEKSVLPVTNSQGQRQLGAQMAD